MKILQINKYHYYRAGADKHYLDIAKALKEKGHEVAYFSMKHPKNIKSSWSKYFVSRLNFKKLSFLDILKLPSRMIYSLEAKRKLIKLIEDFKPDIIHAHNIYHHISPSIIDVAKKKKIPFILHLQDYKLICPNYNIYSDGKNHWDYCGGRFYRCFLNKCFKNSYFKSLLVSIEYFVHHYLLNIYTKVDFFIAPSLFMKKYTSMFGFKKEKIKVITNHVKDKDIIKKPTSKGSYWLYFGRLAKEKGIQDLIKALNEIDDNSILKIAGDGPYKQELIKLIDKLKLKNKVIFLGKVFGNDLNNLIKNSKAVVIPSIWPENMPLALLETIGLAKPSIVANSGGMTEVIEHRKNGFIFKAGDVEELKKVMTELDNCDYNKMSQEALNSAEKYKLSFTINQLINLYQEVLKNKK